MSPAGQSGTGFTASTFTSSFWARALHRPRRSASSSTTRSYSRSLRSRAENARTAPLQSAATPRQNAPRQTQLDLPRPRLPKPPCPTAPPQGELPYPPCFRGLPGGPSIARLPASRKSLSLLAVELGPRTSPASSPRSAALPTASQRKVHQQQARSKRSLVCGPAERQPPFCPRTCTHMYMSCTHMYMCMCMYIPVARDC
mmetsp:Transcript_11188/g.19096  ORF Transcript_11188/g.19096 Transcript_11188/m.19096 type:complete len:200 (+) Transcript_11188:1543-2142(+)